jgi:16S rRNA (adenine1518-N6/adenine1519-N6)-dimethyltransferase
MPTKLGQNFLINKDIVKRIIQSADLTMDDFVLEIGPGKGILTEELAKFTGKVIAIEIDGKLVEFLRDKFKNQKNVKIINQDILKLDIKSILCHSERGAKIISRRSEACKGREAKSNNFWKLDPSSAGWRIGMTHKYKVVANLPYYITSPVIRKFLEAEAPPSEMILMVQKEVAERITAIPGKMSILAVSVQYYAKPEILFYVEKENFEPVPKIDSAVIKITPHPPRYVSGHPLPEGEGDINKKFFRVVRAGFCAKRKTLANNLANSFHLDKKIVEEKLKAAGVSPTARAQELSIEDWKKLALDKWATF